MKYSPLFPFASRTNYRNIPCSIKTYRLVFFNKGHILCTNHKTLKKLFLKIDSLTTEIEAAECSNTVFGWPSHLIHSLANSIAWIPCSVGSQHRYSPFWLLFLITLFFFLYILWVRCKWFFIIKSSCYTAFKLCNLGPQWNCWVICKAFWFWACWNLWGDVLI